MKSEHFHMLRTTSLHHCQNLPDSVPACNSSFQEQGKEDIMFSVACTSGGLCFGAGRRNLRLPGMAGQAASLFC